MKTILYLLRRRKLIFVFTLLFAAQPFQTIYAYDKDYYSSQTIRWYNPDATYCDNTTTTSTTDITIETSDNLETLLKYFTGKGFSLAAAAGIAGNIRQESGFNPAIIQGGGNATADTDIMKLKFPNGDNKGFGLAQWTDSSRKQNLVNFAKAEGKAITDMGMQLDFMFKEMSAAGYAEMISKLNANTNDPVAAAAVFHGLTPDIEAEGAGMDPTFKAANAGYGYERSGDTSQEVIKNRSGAAKSTYERYKDSIQDGTGVAIAEADIEDGDTFNPSTSNSCGSNTESTGSVGVGDGKFTDSGEVAGWSTVEKNSIAVDRIWGEALEGDGWCASIVSRTWRGQDIGYGVNYAETLWTINAKNGIGHADRSPKVGSILIYHSDNQAAGHVTIYLGNNRILNDGKLRDANYVEAGGWGLKYLGWIDPNDLGWTTKEASDEYIKSVMGRFDEAG